MIIQNSSLEDLEQIMSLFSSAVSYQRARGYNLWPLFEKQLIEQEIREKRHWKIMEGNMIACIFSVMYSDPVIWGKEKNSDPAVYLHRITTDPLFKGRGMMGIIKQWAIEHAKNTGKKYVRMDTWGDNENLRNYYISCGFNYLGQTQLKQVEGMPGHYGGSLLSLFEIEVK